MASKKQTQNAISQSDVRVELENEEEEEAEEEEEEVEVKKLEVDLNEMAQKILNYRTTLPDKLKSTLASVLAAQRPVIESHFDSGSESQPGPSNDSRPDAIRPAGSGNGLLTGENEDAEKIRLLKEKISSNASAMPIVLKRMKDCMARIDQLESCNGIIHPAFKRKRTS